MTLVVARQVDNEVYIVGDTKFTNSHGSVWSESKKYIGGLKVVILSPGLCVGFAGDVENARNAIQGIYDRNINLFDKNQSIEYFLEHHRRSLKNGSPTDFIVAGIMECVNKPGTFIKEIFRISDSKVYWENETAHIHIGNNHAFNSFQKAFHQGGCNYSDKTIFEISKLSANDRPAFNQSLSSAMRAMREVIDDPKILCVDGIRTVVVSEEDQFRYVEYVQVRGLPIPVRNEPGTPVHFGAAAEGSAHWHVGMFSSFGHGIFPVYSITGSFGLIYHPENCFEPIIVHSCTLEEFRAQVGERISVAHQRCLSYQARF